MLVAYIFAKVNLIPASVSKRWQRRTRRNSADIPLEQLEPMINQTPQPMIPKTHTYITLIPTSSPFDQLTRANSFLNRIL
jgi:hypothetical protein